MVRYRFEKTLNKPRHNKRQQQPQKPKPVIIETTHKPIEETECIDKPVEIKVENGKRIEVYKYHL